MARILHIFRPTPSPRGVWGEADGLAGTADAEAACLLGADVVRAGGPLHETLVLGGSDAGEECSALGLAWGYRLTPPLALRRTAGTLVRRFHRARGPFEAVVVWDVRLAELTAKWLGPRVRVLGVDMVKGRVLEYHGYGIPPSESETLDPALGIGTAGGEDRGAARARLGVGEDVRVVGLVGDGPAGGVALAYVIGILHVAGLRVMGVVSRRTSSFRRAWRHAGGPGAVPLMAVPECHSRLLGALDLGIVAPGTRGAVSFGTRVLAARALAQGVTVVAPAGTIGAGVPGVVEARSGLHADLAQAAHRCLREGAGAGIERPAAVDGGLGERVVMALRAMGVSA